MARSVAPGELPTVQLVVAKSGLFSLGKSLLDEKELSSSAVLRPWLLAARPTARRAVL